MQNEIFWHFNINYIVFQIEQRPDANKLDLCAINKKDNMTLNWKERVLQPKQDN